jgi:hypothetical protein
LISRDGQFSAWTVKGRRRLARRKINRMDLFINGSGFGSSLERCKNRSV